MSRAIRRRVLLRTFAMAEKEVMHILRDRQVLLFALGMPLVLIFLFGFAVRFDIDHIPLVVVDQQQSARSRALVERFAAGDTFVVAARRTDPGSVEPLFRNAVAKAALVIPPDFDRALARGADAAVQLLLDGSDNTTAAIAQGYATALALEATQAQFQDLLAFVGASLPTPIEARVHTLFNPALRSSRFLVPGLIVIILVMVAVMLTALTVAREYERGSMEQLFATPVGRLEVILGKLAPYFVIGIVQVLLVLTIGVSVFDVPVQGSLLLVFAAALLMLLAMLMQGLFISTVTKNQMVASQVAAISTLLPALLLSGFLFPVDGMPLVLRLIASVLPARYFVHALRAILLRGNGLDVIGVDLLAMAAYFFFMLLLALRRFRRAVA